MFQPRLMSALLFLACKLLAMEMADSEAVTGSIGPCVGFTYSLLRTLIDWAEAFGATHPLADVLLGDHTTEAVKLTLVAMSRCDPGRGTLSGTPVTS